MNSAAARSYLAREPLLYIDMLESIGCGSARLISVSDFGVLLFNSACGAYMMSAQSGETAAKMLESVSFAELFVAHQTFYIEAVQIKLSLAQKMVCLQAAYFREEPLSPPPCPAQIAPLGEVHLPFVMENYSHAESAEYQMERIRSGAMLGAFINGEPAGFVGLHSEGSIGMLEVLPQFRRLGVAQALMVHTVNRLLKEGKTPFSQIEEHNAASLALHEKLGFEISQNKIAWLF